MKYLTPFIRILLLLLFPLFPLIASAQLTVPSGVDVQDGTGHLLTQGSVCFSPFNASGLLTAITPSGGSSTTGPFCFPVTQGVIGSASTINIPDLFTSSPLGLNYQVTVYNQTAATVTQINWITTVTGPSWVFDTLVVPVSLNTLASSSGLGIPYFGCSPGASFTSLNPSSPARAGWECAVTNGYPQWFQTGNSPAPGPAQAATIPVVAQMIKDANLGGGGGGGGNVIASPQSTVATYPTATPSAIVQGNPAVTIDASGATRMTVNNPITDPTLKEQAQMYSSAGFTFMAPPASSGGIQGVKQQALVTNNFFAAPGWSRGQGGCPLNCPQAGYSTVGQWMTILGNAARNNYFSGAGIRNSFGDNTYCVGIGDCSLGAGATFNYCSGGYQAPSDEGCFMDGEAHGYTPPDGVGTLMSVPDPFHILVSATNEVPYIAWGQGRFIEDTTHSVLANTPIAIDYSPGQNGHPYGTLVIDSSSPGVTPDNAEGTLVGTCVVPVQSSTTVPVSCVVAVTMGAFNTTSPVCIGEGQAGNYDIGVRVTTASALSGGQQTLAFANIRRSVGATTAWVFQGPTCGTMADMTADIGAFGQNGEIIHGSAYPIFGALDAHTIVYFAYDASQAAGIAPSASGSAFRSETIAASAGSVFGGAIPVVNAQRIGGMFTATATAAAVLGGNPRPLDALQDAREYTISGCADTTLNGLQSNEFSLTGPTATGVSIAQTGADTAVCPNALLTPNTTLINLNYAAEMYNVTDPAVSNAATAVDGLMEVSWQPNFVVGHTMDSPPHYSANITGKQLNLGIGQPSHLSQGYRVLMTGISAFNTGAFTAFSQPTLNLMSGFGGNRTPPIAFQASGPFIFGLNMDASPTSGGCIICVGPSVNPNTGMKHYSLYRLIGGATADNYDEPSATFTRTINNTVIGRVSATQSTDVTPREMADTLFDSLSSARVTSPTNQIHDCGAFAGVNTVCYGQYIPSAFPIASVVGTPGTTQYVYQMLVHYVYGDEWGPLNPSGIATTGAATLNTTNYISLACTNLPAGTTASLYWDNGGVSYAKVGDCANSSSVVLDQGTRGPTLSGSSISLSAPFYAGAHMSAPNGAFVFITGGFGSTALNPTAMMSQPSPGSFCFDTTVKGNCAGTINAAHIQQGGTPLQPAAFTTGLSFVDTEALCTITYTNGVATAHTGSGCPYRAPPPPISPTHFTRSDGSLEEERKQYLGPDNRWDYQQILYGGGRETTHQSSTAHLG